MVVAIGANICDILPNCNKNNYHLRVEVADAKIKVKYCNQSKKIEHIQL